MYCHVDSKQNNLKKTATVLIFCERTNSWINCLSDRSPSQVDKYFFLLKMCHCSKQADHTILNHKPCHFLVQFHSISEGHSLSLRHWVIETFALPAGHLVEQSQHMFVMVQLRVHKSRQGFKVVARKFCFWSKVSQFLLVGILPSLQAPPTSLLNPPWRSVWRDDPHDHLGSMHNTTRL